MTADARPRGAAGDGQADPFSGSAAWMQGAAEALGVLTRRRPADRLRAAQHAVELLARDVEPTDWGSAGLDVPAAAPGAAGDSPPAAGRVPAGDPAVLRLARAAMALRSFTLRTTESARAWARMAGFFAQIMPPDAPALHRIQSTALYERSQVGDQSQEVIDGLSQNYEWYGNAYGRNAYLTSLTRTNLAVAYRRRAAGADLDLAENLFREEIDTRTRRYGGEHPFVLVARNLLARCLLAKAEAAGDPKRRRELSLQAYAEAEHVRAARDVLFGATSANATLSRRHQGHALLLLGGADALNRALVCLRHVLAFETARNDNAEWRGSGQTHLLLARVYLALGDNVPALRHARHAHRLLTADAPAGRPSRDAAALVHKLSDMCA